MSSPPPPPDHRHDAIRAPHSRASSTARRRSAGTRRARAWNLAVDQHPASSPCPPTPPTLSRSSTRPARPACGSRPGHRPQRRPPTAISTARCCSGPRGCAGSRSTLPRGSPASSAASSGARWRPAAPHGLMALQGSSHDVGVVGYSLGGGVSLPGPQARLASERLRAVEIVTGDGGCAASTATTTRTCSGRCAAAAATSASSPRSRSSCSSADSVYAGALFFPMERAAEVLPAWRRWTARRARGDDLDRRAAAFPAAAGGARAAARQVLRGARGLLARTPPRATAAGAAARARPGHGHGRERRPGRPAAGPHGPARAGSRNRRPPDAAASTRRRSSGSCSDAGRGPARARR